LIFCNPTHFARLINANATEPKRDRPGVPWDLLDAALRFLQGIGRLVRREGLSKNRRIYVLDARLSDPEQALRLAPFVRALSKYKRMVFVRDIEKKTVLLNEPIPAKT